MKKLLVFTGLLFIVLKVAGYVDWSWWVVTMPFWGGYLMSVLIAVLLLYVMIRARN